MKGKITIVRNLVLFLPSIITIWIFSEKSLKESYEYIDRIPDYDGGNLGLLFLLQCLVMILISLLWFAIMYRQLTPLN